MGSILGVIKGETRSLDYSSCSCTADFAAMASANCDEAAAAMTGFTIKQQLLCFSGCAVHSGPLLPGA